MKNSKIITAGRRLAESAYKRLAWALVLMVLVVGPPARAQEPYKQDAVATFIGSVVICSNVAANLLPVPTLITNALTAGQIQSNYATGQLTTNYIVQKQNWTIVNAAVRITNSLYIASSFIQNTNAASTLGQTNGAIKITLADISTNASLNGTGWIDLCAFQGKTANLVGGSVPQVWSWTDATAKGSASVDYVIQALPRP